MRCRISLTLLSITSRFPVQFLCPFFLRLLAAWRIRHPRRPSSDRRQTTVSKHLACRDRTYLAFIPRAIDRTSFHIRNRIFVFQPIRAIGSAYRQRLQRIQQAPVHFVERTTATVSCYDGRVCRKEEGASRRAPRRTPANPQTPQQTQHFSSSCTHQAHFRRHAFDGHPLVTTGNHQTGQPPPSQTACPKRQTTIQTS